MTIIESHWQCAGYAESIISNITLTLQITTEIIHD